MRGTADSRMIDTRLTAEEHARLRSLFDLYNQQYFAGRLPRYKVALSDRYKHSRCFKGERKIYINPDGEISDDLLHEMVHAAIGYGHGKLFLMEVKRLVELGAPLQKDLNGYATK